MAAPAPNGCRLCGIEQRGHAIQVGRDGSHTWTAPTQQQIKDRMLAQRAAKEEIVKESASDDDDVCRAAQYVSVPDSYNGAALCGCDNCREYVAERESEDEV